MPVPSALVTQYFQLLANRQITEAKHELEIIKLSLYFIISERELETTRQLLTKGQIDEAKRELDRLKQLLVDRQFAIVDHEFDGFRRSLISKHIAETPKELEIIKRFLADRQFAEADREAAKLQQSLIGKQLEGDLRELKRFRWILANKQFAEAADVLNLLTQLLENRQLAKAERELERFKVRIRRTEWDRGYFRALYGMFLSRKTNGDAYAFFSKLDLSDKAALHNYRREFSDHVGSKLHGDFDRGYFSAWADCMRVFSRMNVAVSLSANGAVAEKGKLETVKSDKSQATMQNFLKEEED